ncbi:late competence protein ComEC, DNA transport [Geomicrobium sp. JCM 19037]|uniref:ComEC/Rec2 family competence protein n=1 Tax=Geomicrobium sp. JCM 19037 TaxID=1460634 RepID=UPI00045F13AC|nr:ComEC/Rec2 family competence protein [Geomicrobium sp. JCM 19037]GAK02793.1 late competence protein ComEC, DNA transport [Geomicrobium sp. JCM 19037]
MNRLGKWVPVLCLTLLLVGCDFEESGGAERDPGGESDWNHAEIVFYDVGQGDSTLLRDGETTILIDTGRHDDDRILSYLEEDEVGTIDLLVLTHPHADHIGNADVILDQYDVSEVWMSGEEHTSLTYERIVDAILESDADYEEPRAGDDTNIGQFQIEVVGPDQLTGNLNDGSIAMRVEVEGVKMLFTGDAEEDAEEQMLEQPERLQADIFHAGHHGSSTSNTAPFLDAVDPEVAIYSAGADNEYGHPHDEVVERIHEKGIDLFGTAEHGEVYVIIEDGEWELYTER